MSSADQPNSSSTTQPSPLPQPKHYPSESINKEYEHLISSLPTQEESWISKNLYQYQGYWHFPVSLHGALTCQKHFQAQNTDIILATTPKSGTTWLKALIYAIINRSSFEKESSHNHPLATKITLDLMPYLELNLFADGQVPDLSSLPSPRLLSTHLPFTSLPSSVRDSGCKVVYLCREPKDAFVSFWHFMNKIMPDVSPSGFVGPRGLEEAFGRFCEGVHWYGPFWDHVLGYWKQSLEEPTKVMFLTYEEMKQQPKVYVKRLAEFLGCPFCFEEEEDGVVERILELCSFENLKELEANKSGKFSAGGDSKSLFRKGEIGDWMNYLTPEMAKRIDQITEEKLRGSGFNKW